MCHWKPKCHTVEKTQPNNSVYPIKLYKKQSPRGLHDWFLGCLKSLVRFWGTWLDSRNNVPRAQRAPLMCLCRRSAPSLLTLPGIHIPLVSLVGKNKPRKRGKKTAEGKIEGGSGLGFCNSPVWVWLIKSGYSRRKRKSGSLHHVCEQTLETCNIKMSPAWMGPFEKEVMSQSPSKALLLPQSEKKQIIGPRNRQALTHRIQDGESPRNWGRPVDISWQQMTELAPSQYCISSGSRRLEMGLVLAPHRPKWATKASQQEEQAVQGLSRAI